MCGIVGYIGDRRAQPILLDCLTRLEYRGYDSCGIAVAARSIDTYKDAGKVDSLAKAAPPFDGRIGIGHTRWATHGGPSRSNAHPHLDCKGNIAVVHNGVIRNYEALRNKLGAEGHNFLSETDTEVIPHLIEAYFDGDLEKAVLAALCDIDGSYAIAVIMAGESRLVVARKESPLVVGVGVGENFIASDVPAIHEHTDKVIYLEDGDTAVVTRRSIAVKRGGAPAFRRQHVVSWHIEEAHKTGYEHFMLKEISEQPRVIRDTLGEYAGQIDPDNGWLASRNGSKESILILACGTSYHAGLIGKYIMESLLRIPVKVELASEYNYCDHSLERGMAIAITQSGETADTLKAMKKLKEVGGPVLAITNVFGSTASRIADQVIYTKAGPELSVAATKSFLAQLMAFYWLAVRHCRMDEERLTTLLLDMRQLPSRVQEVLDEPSIFECARHISEFKNVFLIGRAINYPVALEGALKLKEVSYIHAEGYAAGEAKHGPLALLGKESLVIAAVARDSTHEPMLTSIKEIKARGSLVIALAEEGDDETRRLADSLIRVPRVGSLFSPVVNVVALQLLAYHAAKQLGCSIDRPRNLAKSVTVE